MSESPSLPSASGWGQRTGIAATAKYNPHLWSADELRAIFVARQRELAAILEVLRTAAPDVAPQHLLITGQRGMGKSTLLQRVALAVEDEAELHQAWLPLRFPEEQYTVSTPAELWSNVIGALGDALERHEQPTVEVDAELAHLMNLPKEQREEAALAWIKQWCETHHQRLLLLIDSTDLLFANLAGGDANKRGTKQDGGASALWRVRKALLHSPHLLWLGGSYQPLEAHGLYSDAFLDFFQLIELRPLTSTEMQTAIQAMARVFGAGRGLLGDEAEAEVKRVLTTRPERLRAMRQLTGGNPRTTVMLYELFAAGGRDNVRADLERLLDAMTPLYKARLEVLADQPRKVLAHVMEHWAPVTAKALSRAAALPVSSVSAQLTRLEQEGLVEKTTLSGTKRLGYQCSERFFNIWYLMRNAPRGARARVGWLVEFMRLWYSNDELQGLARTRRNRHRADLDCDGSELEYSRAIVYAMPKDAPERRQLDWAVFQQARKSNAFGELYELDGEDANCLPSDRLNRPEEAEAACRRAIKLDPGRAVPWCSLGDLLCDKLHRFEEAEAAYRKAIELDPKWAQTWAALGDLLSQELNRHEEAEAAYRTAMGSDQINPLPVVNLARLLARLKRRDEANELFRQALKLVEKDDHNIQLQANCWLGNNDLAMQALDALAELASKSDGSAFHELKEQCFGCHSIGLSKPLVALMERSRFADFLQPFALALRAASGDKDALLDVAVEVRGMAEEVLTQINGAR